MSDDQERYYSLDEILAMHPECPTCGSTNTRVEPLPFHHFGEPVRYRPGLPTCLDCVQAMRDDVWP